MNEHYDYIVIGGGIVGISTALQLQQVQPEHSILLIEKEPKLAAHQTGHNSGVIHAGVYYQPGTMKADFCKRGAAATLQFCQQHNIEYRQPGKLLVATNALELDRMDSLYKRCLENGTPAERIDQNTLVALEPNIVGFGALKIKSTGIVDYQQIANCMADLFRQAGGTLYLNTLLEDAKEWPNKIELTTSRGLLTAGFLISCAGLHADRITAMLEIDTDFAIIPFRGEYYQLSKNKQGIINHMIYPIPDPDLPFLGVHLTPMIDGTVTAGPNAVLGWKREGYGSINFSLGDSLEMLKFPGFWKVCKNHYLSGLREYRNSWMKSGYLRQVQKYCPSLSLSDLRTYPAGVRAQAVKSDGSLVHDFLFAESNRSLNVCNAPSPAATSAIPIGEHIVDRVTRKNVA